MLQWMAAHPQRNSNSRSLHSPHGQAVTRIGASPAEIASFLSNSYGPSWDTAIAQERLVELLSDSAQVRILTAAIPGPVRKIPLSIMTGIRQSLWLLRWSAVRLHSLHVVQHVWRCNAPLHCEQCNIFCFVDTCALA